MQLRHVILGLLWVITACDTAGDYTAQNCPAIGIDIYNPDFNQAHSVQEIDGFYRCAMNAPRRYEIFNQERSLDVSYAIQYQWNLWQQIHAGSKTRLGAQQAWMEWRAREIQQQAMRDQLEEIEDAARGREIQNDQLRRKAEDDYRRKEFCKQSWAHSNNPGLCP